MDIEKLCEKDRNLLQRLLSFQLPYKFKKIGLILVILCFLALTALKFSTADVSAIQMILKKIFLLSLLLVSISRDEIEDELVVKLRVQAYSMAFLCGIIYAIVQPYINFIVEETTAFELGDFQVLTFMLLLHLGFFHLLKRIR
ncbi:MAG: hypothetical protein DWQ06_11575 [Calditrichaeota bacterium]|nr:MAG: hypothetical protein DWQ06_11575 [Calditrichota bacterium]